jgi:hypothetical protein
LTATTPFTGIRLYILPPLTHMDSCASMAVSPRSPVLLAFFERRRGSWRTFGATGYWSTARVSSLPRRTRRPQSTSSPWSTCRSRCCPCGWIRALLSATDSSPSCHTLYRVHLTDDASAWWLPLRQTPIDARRRPYADGASFNASSFSRAVQTSRSPVSCVPQSSLSLRKSLSRCLHAEHWTSPMNLDYVVQHASSVGLFRVPSFSSVWRHGSSMRAHLSRAGS